jgi:hypothetical protein
MRREIVIDDAALNCRYELHLAGALCRLLTNSPAVGETLRAWQATDTYSLSPAFDMRVRVNHGASASVGRPHFRGMRHLVIASFGEANIFVFDLLRRNVSAVISETVVSDSKFWDRILLPIVVGVLGPAVGVVPVHSACLQIDGAGILIAGASGAGKSTLSVALAQQGFHFVSDDWTYLTVARGELVAHGMSSPAKLLPDAVNYFPGLTQFPLCLALNHELAYELPAEKLGAEVKLSCEPRWFFFLERTATEERCQLLPVSADEAQLYVERSVERLPTELELMIQARTAIISQLSRLSCWKLSYGGPPSVAVRGLQHFFTGLRQGVPA